MVWQRGRDSSSGNEVDASCGGSTPSGYCSHPADNSGTSVSGSDGSGDDTDLLLDEGGLEPHARLLLERMVVAVEQPERSSQQGGAATTGAAAAGSSQPAGDPDQQQAAALLTSTSGTHPLPASSQIGQQQGCQQCWLQEYAAWQQQYAAWRREYSAWRALCSTQQPHV